MAKTIGLLNGYKIKVNDINPILLMQARSSVQKPKPPYQKIDGRMYPNFDHQDYKEDMARYRVEVGIVGINVMLTSVDVIDGPLGPDDDSTKKQLKQLQKMNIIDQQWDINDVDDRLFLYKKHIVFSDEKSIETLNRCINKEEEEDIQKWLDGFRGN